MARLRGKQGADSVVSAGGEDAVAALKGLGLYDRTMIVLTSDHGEEFFEHRGWLHTHSVYEEVLRVPLVMKLFGSRNAARVVTTPAYLVDILPTIAAETGSRKRASSP